MKEQLLQYQEIDRDLKKIEDELKNDESNKNYEKSTQFMMKAKRAVVQMEERASLLLNEFRDKQEKLAKLDEIKKELPEPTDDSDEKQLAYYSRRAQEISLEFTSLESQLKELEKNLNELLAQYRNLNKKYKEAKATRESSKEKCDEQAKAAAPKMEEIRKKLKAIENELSGDPLLQKYKEKRKDGRFPIFVKESGGYCSACGTELALVEKEHLKRDKIIECSNCHALVYDPTAVKE